MLCHLSTDEKYPDTKLLNQYHLYFPQIENHIQIVYLINPPWYDHFKLILRILESNYKLMSYTDSVTLWIANLLVHQRVLTLSAQEYH